MRQEYSAAVACVMLCGGLPAGVRGCLIGRHLARHACTVPTGGAPHAPVPVAPLLAALHGAVNTIDHHGGSALSLLTLLLGHTTALCACRHAALTRAPLRLPPAAAAVVGIALRLLPQLLAQPHSAGALSNRLPHLALCTRLTCPPAPPNFPPQMAPWLCCMAASCSPPRAHWWP